MDLVLGITGGSGSGKSTVTKFLKESGASVIDADIVAREIVMPGQPALVEIVKAFGDDVILPDGTMDRKKVGKIVFSDKEKLNILNSITHKYIIEKIKKYVEENQGFIVIDAALLFQTELYKLCDKTLAVTAGASLREERIEKRDGLTKELAKNRISSQDDESFYEKLADYVIVNDKSLEDLKNKVNQFLKEIM